uniref:TCTP domain-containing protein n=1 Tax=Terrapene triunguis TaxID=2587831 RepID=A0A674I7I0_9SAUR
MIIYRDCISQDEMFSDIYSIREVADRLCLEVEGKMVTRTEGQIADALIGGNADPTDITGVDIVMNHHLQETSFTKESYKKYIKDYMKAIKARLEEHKPDRVKPFMTGAAEQVKHIINMLPADSARSKNVLIKFETELLGENCMSLALFYPHSAIYFML